MAQRSRVRTVVKKVQKALRSGDKDAAEARFREAVPEIDRMASKGIIPKNRAAHYKSRLNAKLRALA